MKSLSPLETSYPFRLAEPSLDNFGIALFSRFEPLAMEIRHIGGEPSPSSVVARLKLGGKIVTVIGTHPLPPVNLNNAQSRNRQVEALARLAKETPHPILVLGDLNMTPWSPHFGDLLRRSGLRDGRKGFGIQATWPADTVLLRIPIDHCLVSPDIVVLDYRVGPEIGSDHRPVVIDFALSK